MENNKKEIVKEKPKKKKTNKQSNNKEITTKKENYNLVNKPVKKTPDEEKDKHLLIAIIALCILLVLVIYKKYIMPISNDETSDKNNIVEEILDINSEQVQKLYNYVNVNGTGYDYFLRNQKVDIFNFDNKIKMILAFNLIDENVISTLAIPNETYENALETLIGSNPYYSNYEAFDVCVFKNINNIPYNCYNVAYDSTTKNYILTNIDSTLQTCQDGYAKLLLSAKKENNQIIIKSGYAYVTNICDSKINVYDDDSKTTLVGTLDNSNPNNNYYDVDISLFKDNIKTVNYVFQLDSDSNYYFYESYWD